MRRATTWAQKVVCCAGEDQSFAAEEMQHFIFPVENLNVDED